MNFPTALGYSTHPGGGNSDFPLQFASDFFHYNIFWGGGVLKVFCSFFFPYQIAIAAFVTFFFSTHIFQDCAKGTLKDT